MRIWVTGMSVFRKGPILIWTPYFFTPILKFDELLVRQAEKMLSRIHAGHVQAVCDSARSFGSSALEQIEDAILARLGQRPAINEMRESMNLKFQIEPIVRWVPLG